MKAGVSRNFVIQSIKRLKKSGLLDYITSKATKDKNNSNRYSFEELHGFDQIPVSFFNLDDLTYAEKGMLLCIRQYFVHGWLTTTFSMSTMAHWIGISYKTLYSQFIKLIGKGYIQEIKKGKKGQRICYVLTDMIKWITGQKKTDEFKITEIRSLKVS